jgi:hypothetical protein
VESIETKLILLFENCKNDPANINHLYTLVGQLTMYVTELHAAVDVLNKELNLRKPEND